MTFFSRFVILAKLHEALGAMTKKLSPQSKCRNRFPLQRTMEGWISLDIEETKVWLGRDRGVLLRQIAWLCLAESLFIAGSEEQLMDSKRK